MSRVINVDFNDYIPKLNDEIEVYKSNDKIIRQLEDIKLDLLSITNPVKEDLLQNILNEINLSFSLLRSTGYSGKVIHELIEYIVKILRTNSISGKQLENLEASGKNNQISPILNNQSKDLIKVINENFRSTVNDVITRALKDNTASLEASSRILYDNIKSLINKSLISLSDDISHQITLARAHSSKTGSLVKPIIKDVDDDTTKTIVEASKLLHKSAKDILEQNSTHNDINNEILKSITEFKKTFSLKRMIIHLIIAWTLSGIGGYFIVSHITNDMTKINQYQKEHEAIQNLKLIRQNLDKDGKRCWNKLFK